MHFLSNFSASVAFDHPHGYLLPREIHFATFLWLNSRRHLKDDPENLLNEA
jgi:hypothetical protein